MSGWTEFTGRRVLTVDDSRAVRLFLEDMLTRHGAVVEPAATGAQALERLQHGEGFDLVLLDLNLPDIDGLEVLDRIRAADARVPVVMITSAGGLHSATQAVRHGADGYVEKQHLTGDGDDPFLYALLQAVEHRTGIVARQQLDETRADFYSMVTHDLRNPAGNVLSIIKLLTSGKAGPLTQRQEQLLAIAATSAGRLTDLINDYLDYATIDAGYLRLERRDVDLRKVAHDAAHLAGPQAGLRQITISLDLPRQPVCARVDAERLSQVLDNLISNAIKYTQEGGWILLSLAEEEGCAVLRVRDTGIGIAPDEAPRLFARFQRVPGESTRGIRGTGLGLLIVKEIAEAHGGSVQVHSPGPGKGTTFTVRVPLQTPEAAASADADPGIAAGHASS